MESVPLMPSKAIAIGEFPGAAIPYTPDDQIAATGEKAAEEAIP
jgi:hypothetical protein